jgi:hypothetical protein
MQQNRLNNGQPFTIIHPENPVPKPPPDPLLTVRAAVILLLALIAGGVAGVLGYLAHRSFPGALLIAGSAAGGAIMLFNNMIDR